MREILFRGKDNDSEEWVYGFYTYVPNSEGALTHKIIATNSYGSTEYHVAPETVGQYTGLDDKNGVKIFEGDIVQPTLFEIEDVADVQFVYGTFGIEWVSCKKDKTMHSSDQLHNLRRFDDGVNKYVEVIGNIHDNPELLNKETK
jgi:uncharacterized phage protein (TIGR01671 family)